MKSIVLILAATTALQANAGITIGEAFTGVTPDDAACYTRSYSSRHLMRNPRQTVENIKIKLGMTKFEGSQEPTPLLSIQVKRKGEEQLWTNTIACFETEERTVKCAVDCDGGSVDILSRNSRGVMTLRNNGVLLYGGCGELNEKGEEVESIWLKAERGGDDVFRLNGTNVEDCDSISTKF